MELTTIVILNLNDALTTLLFFVETSKSGEEEITSDEESDNDTGETSADTTSSQTYDRPRKSSLPTTKHNHFGSFYLRMGAVGTVFNYLTCYIIG